MWGFRSLLRPWLLLLQILCITRNICIVSQYQKGILGNINRNIMKSKRKVRVSSVVGAHLSIWRSILSGLGEEE